MLKKMVGGPNRTFIYDKIKMHASGKRVNVACEIFCIDLSQLTNQQQINS
jgi:hypothetical protein